MLIKNSIPKGTILLVSVTLNGNINLHYKDYVMEITNYLTDSELTAVRHLKEARALVIDEQTINLVLYVNYHVHSEYSILDGLSKLPELAKKSSGITALTDHGNMHGMVKWQNAMKKEGKKAIFGCEVYTNSIDGTPAAYHLLLLAKDEVGKHNLFSLVSNAYYNFYKKPQITYEELANHSQGLICTSACIGGEVSQKLLEGDYRGAKEVAEKFQEIFNDDFYLEIQRHHIEEEDKVNPLLLQLANECNIKLVAGNDSHYVSKKDSDIHEILLCISTKKKLSEEHWSFKGDGYHFMSDIEMISLFWDIPDVITNTFEIAEKCNLTIETGVYHFPRFNIPESFSNEEEYLKSLIYNGFRERFNNSWKQNNDEYINRINYEIEVILSMGFAGYFLIVWDFVKYAKDHNIYVGPGRGSAVGSLVCYCLKITDLDPLEYHLLFERFLNPERISMPDIDVDFQFERRHEVIEYVKTKYGEECISRIVTFGTMQSRLAIQDVSRTVAGNYHLGDEIKDLMPEKASNLEECFDSEEFTISYESNKQTKEVVDIAMRLEGNKRQTGVHACGVIISDKPISNYMPTALVMDKKTKSKTLVTQCEEAEDLGLLKVDFLGLRNMSVIGNTMSKANQRRAEKGLPVFKHWREIPINDPYVYIPISEGKCHAIFQIESNGMRSFMKQLFCDVKKRLSQIETHYHLTGYGEFMQGDGLDKDGFQQSLEQLGNELFKRMIAGISLYRPGPMDYIPQYIEGMMDPSKVTYDVSQLEPILKETYGVICYQEQVMQIVRELAGFSKGQSDNVRRGMGKKKQEIMDEYKPLFLQGSGDLIDSHTGKPYNIKGCVANGISKETAEAIWDKMKDFAKYAFNKSHAGGYAVITVSCAWLKYYYPDLYMMGQLNAFMDTADKFKGYLSITRSLNISILPPDINKSVKNFTVETDNKLRFGFGGLKGISKNAELIENERLANGFYKSFKDVLLRLIPLKFNKRHFTALILSGAFDCFGYTRKDLLMNLDSCLSEARKIINKKKKSNKNQISLFQEESEDFTLQITNEEFANRELLDLEKQSSGMYISSHPLDEYNDILQKVEANEISFFLSDDDNDSSTGYRSKNVTFVGIVKNPKLLHTKKDNLPMGSFVLEDRSGEMNAIVFNKYYADCKNSIKDDEVVVVKGVVNNNDGFGQQIVVHTLYKIDLALVGETKNVYVRVNTIEDVSKVKSITNNYPGKVPTFAWVNKEQKWFAISNIKPTSSLYMKLMNQLGTSNVQFQ